MTLAEHDGSDTIELPLVDLPIVWSYQRIQGLELHSLACRSSYWCTRCGQQREATLVAIDETQALVCPACFPSEVVEKAHRESQEGDHDRSFGGPADRRSGRQRRAGHPFRVKGTSTG